MADLRAKAEENKDNPVIWFESDTVAYGKWYLQDNLIFAEGNPYCGTQIQGCLLYTSRCV